MIEMVETAAILHQATSRSLLILDEVGRGTSTDDGLAIARATLEDISRRIGARALFATHYLELTSLAGELPDVTNVHVGALEREGRVVFLYAIRPGPADRAYGVQVARLAGLPPWVADRAEALLAAMPRREQPAALPARMIAEEVEPGDLREDRDVRGNQEGETSPAERLAAALQDLDLNEVSPRQALEWLWEQRDRLVGEGRGVDSSPENAGQRTG
jgi:DNA mismatch repair protein MutS